MSEHVALEIMLSCGGIAACSWLAWLSGNSVSTVVQSGLIGGVFAAISISTWFWMIAPAHLHSALSNRVDDAERERDKTNATIAGHPRVLLAKGVMKELIERGLEARARAVKARAARMEKYGPGGQMWTGVFNKWQDQVLSDLENLYGVVVPSSLKTDARQDDPDKREIEFFDFYIDRLKELRLNCSTETLSHVFVYGEPVSGD